MFKRICNLPQKQSFFLFGPRQTGKSTLLKTQLTAQDWVVDLLQSDVFLAYKKDPAQFRREAEAKIKGGIQAIFIDEVQRIPELLNEVHFLIEKHHCQFIMSGSSARKLKRGSANLLAGRAFARYLFPLTFEELGETFQLNEVLQFGSLPAIFSLDKKSKQDFLSTYTETYLREEIQAEALVRNLGGYIRFLEVVAAQCGELVNYSAIGRECGLPVRTVQSYFEILEETLIAVKLEPWRKSVRKRLSAHPKYYLFDTGITNSINHRVSGEIDSVTRGRLFEQLVILETHRMLAYARSEVRIFYWRTNNGAEVDLLFEKAGKIIAAAEIKSSPKISGADLSGLRSLREDMPHVETLIVSQMPNSFSLDFAKILPFAEYISWLKKL